MSNAGPRARPSTSEAGNPGDGTGPSIDAVGEIVAFVSSAIGDEPRSPAERLGPVVLNVLDRLAGDGGWVGRGGRGVRGVLVDDADTLRHPALRAAIAAPMDTPQQELARRVADRLAEAAQSELASSSTAQLLGSVYERLLGAHMSTRRGDATDEDANGRVVTHRAGRASERHRAGVFYTPDRLVQHVLGEALMPMLRDRSVGAGRPVRVCDPSCGSGRFLEAAAVALIDDAASDTAAHNALARGVFGVDIDPVAVWITRFALLSVATARCGNSAHSEGSFAWLRRNIRVADAMRDPGRTREHQEANGRRAAERLARRFDAVIGNPPFLNQLGSATVRDRELADALGARFGGAIGPYTDTSAVFLLIGLRLCKPGGRLCLVQPVSLLATRDASGVRRELLERAEPISLWASREPVFEGTAVRTCAPCFRVDERTQHPDVNGAEKTRRIAMLDGPGFEAKPPVMVDRRVMQMSATWSHLLAATLGLPDVRVRTPRTLGDFASATADFRDQYYGLAGFIREDDGAGAMPTDAARRPMLITAGLIDPARCLWGERATRVLKQVWHRPVVDRDAMDLRGELGPWMARRLVPKVLLATQTRVLEAVCDAEGVMLPSTPVIVIEPNDEGNVWRIAAVLLSPALSLWAARESVGAGMSAEAIKLSATQVRSLPMPSDLRSLDEAAEHCRAAHDRSVETQERFELLRKAGTASSRAFGLDESQASEAMRWWAGRFPKRR